MKSRDFMDGRSLWYAPDDKTLERRPMRKCRDFNHADELNKAKNGIFVTVNEIEGDRRIIPNLKRIISWAVEFDGIPKEEQVERVKKSGFVPSAVVESKRGYQVYFDAIDGTVANSNRITKAIAKTIGADMEGINVVRVMRMPFYYHWKDPENPYLIRLVSTEDSMYYEQEMIDFFCKPLEEKMEKVTYQKRDYSDVKGTLIHRLDTIGAMEGLKRLSGTAFVNGESYEFIRQSSGNFNIYVNGKSTSCFISKDGRIWSKASGGGGSVLQWLKYHNYGHSKDEAWRILKEIFPELRSNNGRV